ncbi:MAG: hypothetical protein H7123_02290 [Thermoleophilia bacterium]|nr:hypothetical protein [Thermoleophilia bacterium]
MTVLKILLTLHLLGAFALAAGVVLRFVAARMIDADGTPAQNATSSALIRVQGAWLYRGGAMLALLAGLGLVSKTGNSFSDAWISASFTIWLLLFVAGEGFTSRHARFLQNAGPGAPAQQRSGSIRTTTALEVGLVTVLLILMVWRP